MQDIVIRNNGQDDYVFANAHDIKIEELQFNGEGVLSTCTLKFDFDKLTNNHEHNAASRIWTGKFICVANADNYLMFTPGKVYNATSNYIFDDSRIPFKRLEDFFKNCYAFEDVQRQLKKYGGVDIIEYKGEVGEEEPK